MLIFQEKCNNLIESYKKEKGNELWVSKNRTINLGKDPEKPLFSCFSFYPPIKEDRLLPYIKRNYKYRFPEELLSFYAFSNGAKLFTAKIAHEVFTYFAHPCLDVFGFSDKSPDGCPFDIRIEDLARGKKIPKQWLKCGQYSEPPYFHDYDIFIDTKDGRVYLTKKRESEVLQEFASFDDCFSTLYDLLIQKDFQILYPQNFDIQT